jgi:4-amino-4-deoxychorismate lyase
VTLAWFLRYPNPYAPHVLSTDTIHQSFNPQTNILTIVRLHLKRGKLPVWSKRFLSHISESWIVETTEVDMREGRMETRMRNLDHKRVLYVEERGTWCREQDGT